MTNLLAAAVIMINYAQIQQNFTTNDLDVILYAVISRELTDEQTILLFAIRKAENGGPGIEFGVAQDNPKHPARRYKDNPRKSLSVQAIACAEIIKEKYKGNITEFAKMYCKNWQEWEKNVKFYVRLFTREK